MQRAVLEPKIAPFSPRKCSHAQILGTPRNEREKKEERTDERERREDGGGR